MEPPISLQEHLASYNIHGFGDRQTYEGWAEQQLGKRWRQRLGSAYAGIHKKNATHDDVRKAFDSSSQTKFAQINFSGLYATEFAFGEEISRLITGRKRVIDLGCNIGHLTTWYGRTEPDRHVLGVDFSISCVHAARAKAKKLCLTNVDFEVTDVEACELSGTYDAIVESHCLKYIKNMRKVLLHLASLLEPNGILVTTHATLGTQNCNELESLLRSAGLGTQNMMQSGDLFYLGNHYRCCLLVARKQAAGSTPRQTGPSFWWNDPATSQVLLVGA
jgi:2-polyprenyl-3-methyl-5-hydroxy-6-metoxy-1,4-benzoquinol methylase